MTDKSVIPAHAGIHPMQATSVAQRSGLSTVDPGVRRDDGTTP